MADKGEDDIVTPYGEEPAVAATPEDERLRLKEERKALKAAEKARKKEERAKYKDLDNKEAELDTDESGGLATFVITILIILMWLVIMGLLVKLDIGGFGSTVLAPILSDVPYINKILPDSANTNLQPQEVQSSTTATAEGAEAVDSNGNPIVTVSSGNGGGSGDAYVKQLELELQKAQESNSNYAATIERLESEVQRLEPFEDEQALLEAQKQQFYQDIIYNDNAPDASAYASYYEMIDPTAAASLYKEAVKEAATQGDVDTYVKAYTAMKPKQAAAIINQMDDLTLAARILQQMSADDRGAIMGKLDAEVADKITQLLEPEQLPGLPGNNSRGY